MAKRKKLPAWVTTVTPLSKTIALILFILLPFLGFYFGMKYQRALDDISEKVIPIIQPVMETPSTIPHKLYNSR